MHARSGTLVRSSRATEVTRCPFCHESVRTSFGSLPVSEGQTCGSCSAVLHRACWRESAGCASCGGLRVIAPPARVSSWRSVAVGWLVAAVGVAAVLGGGIVRSLASGSGSTPALSVPPAPEGERDEADLAREAAERARVEPERARLEEPRHRETERRIEAELAAARAAEDAATRRVFEIDPAEAVSYWHTSRHEGVATGDDDADEAAAREPWCPLPRTDGPAGQ